MSDLSAILPIAEAAASAHMPPFSFRSTLHSGFTASSPLTSPHQCLSPYGAACDECECARYTFPYASGESHSFESLSPSSSCLSTAESSVCDASPLISAATTPTSTCTPWEDAVVALSPDSDRPINLDPSPPLYALAHSHGGSTNSTSSASFDAVSTKQTRLSVKQRRTVPSTVAEQQQRRRAHHRVLDADRRQRETDAISTLLRLIEQQQQPQEGGAAVEGKWAGDTEEKYEIVLKGKKLDRLTVLESSITLIQQLTAACERTERAHNARDERTSCMPSQPLAVTSVGAQYVAASEFEAPIEGLAPSPHAGSSHSFHVATTQLGSPRPLITASMCLSTLPVSTSPYTAHSHISHTLLQCTASVLLHMSILVIALPSKVLIDVNDVFLSMTGCCRADVLHRAYEAVSFSKGVAQYPASVAAVGAVIDGQKRHGSTTWRCRRADGVLIECITAFYGRYVELPSSGGVAAPSLPDKLLIICAPDEVVIVGEANMADVIE